MAASSKPTKSRRRRGVRARKGRLQLTERDLRLLCFLGLVGHADVAQVARECGFPSLDRTRRRCRRLFDANLLEVTLAGSTRPNLLSLTRAGLKVLADRMPDQAARIKVASPIAWSSVAHTLGITEARCHLTAVAKAIGALCAWRSGTEKAVRELGFQRQRLEPDGIADVFPTDGRFFRLAVEVDLSTEGSAEIARKLKRYAPLHPGVVTEIWFYISGGRGRCLTIIKKAKTCGLAGQVHVLPLDRIASRPPPIPKGSCLSSKAGR